MQSETPHAIGDTLCNTLMQSGNPNAPWDTPWTTALLQRHRAIHRPCSDKCAIRWERACTSVWNVLKTWGSQIVSVVPELVQIRVANSYVPLTVPCIDTET
jgi:hypothetical protein